MAPKGHANVQILITIRDNHALPRYAVTMDINKMLAELRAERDQLAQAIVVLERLSVGQGKRRGRPPKWLTTVKRRGRPKGSKNKPKSD